MPKKTEAKRADRHRLYELSVQVPEADIAILHREFKKRSGRIPLSLREDFCGTALFSTTWVESHADRSAHGVDLDTEVLAWGRAHNLSRIGEGAERVRLEAADVRLPKTPQVDLQVAFNFSYCCFLERADLLAYARAAYASIVPDGLFCLDIHGGSEAFEKLEERKRIEDVPLDFKGAKYVWRQGPLDPLSHRAMRWIGFEFKDGSEIRHAFRYDWRLWTAPELRDVLIEAGFAEVDFYWEGTDKETGKGNGIYRKTRKGENDPSWICYVMAWKSLAASAAKRAAPAGKKKRARS